MVLHFLKNVLLLTAQNKINITIHLSFFPIYYNISCPEMPHLCTQFLGQNWSLPEPLCLNQIWFQSGTQQMFLVFHQEFHQPMVPEITHHWFPLFNESYSLVIFQNKGLFFIQLILQCNFHPQILYLSLLMRHHPPPSVKSSTLSKPCGYFQNLSSHAAIKVIIFANPLCVQLHPQNFSVP